MSFSYNPDQIVIARQLKGWSQSELSPLVKKSQAYISKVECYAAPPSHELVVSVSEMTGFPLSFFSLPTAMGGLPTSVHPMYRKQDASKIKQTMKIKVLDRVSAEMSLRILHLRLLGDLTKDWSNAFGRFHNFVNAEAQSPCQAARNFRIAHGITMGPINNLVQLAEASGIFVFHCDFGDDSDEMVDGVSMHVPGLPPTIFLNKDRPADRQRFSLAHEIGHIFLHQFPSDTMEDEANEFAGELLMPSQDISAILGNGVPVSINRLAALKPYWRVSVQAILYRAQKLEVIPKTQAGSLWGQIHRLGWKKREPLNLDFEVETPTLMQSFVALHHEDAEQFFHTRVDRLKEMYPMRE